MVGQFQTNFDMVEMANLFRMAKLIFNRYSQRRFNDYGPIFESIFFEKSAGQLWYRLELLIRYPKNQGFTDRLVCGQIVPSLSEIFRKLGPMTGRFWSIDPRPKSYFQAFFIPDRGPPSPVLPSGITGE